MMLACDIGLKRIGLATCINGIILPLEPILRINRNQAAHGLTALIESKQITTLIIGLPRSETPACEETRRRILFFCDLVQTRAQKVFVNEDFTSLEAKAHLEHLKRKNKQNALKDGRLDSLAACQILERYLSSQRT